MLMADEHLISLQPGTVIAGRYEVVKCLGAGSMGLVYACRHKELSGHLVAVKVLFPEVAQDKVAAARFRNEIFASYGVSHPNVVRAYEYLRDGDLVAYTMEYVGGGDLADKLGNPQVPMSVSEIISVLSQMCLGVQAIHDAGIIHRDLKPENILLSKEGHVKIADFGIARTGHGPKLTEHGGVVGTIDYVSPEYMLNSQVDWRSDIYAIGILGYEMVTGDSPFRGDSVYATMTKRLKTDPTPPSSIRSECPKELDVIILKAMERDPELRYQSTTEMYQDLDPLRKHFDIKVTNKNIPVESPSPKVSPEKDIDSSTSTNLTAIENSPREEEPQPLIENPTPMQREVSKDRETDSEDTFLKDAGSGGTVVSNIPVLQREGSESSTRRANQAQAGDERKTVQLSPGGERFMQHFEQPSVDEEVSHKMASVLSKNAGVDDWGTRREVPQKVSISHGSIDDNRLQRLSQVVETVNRSIWVDIMTWIVAVLIGVGVGFAFLKLFFPDLVDPHAGYKETTQQIEYSLWE